MVSAQRRLEENGELVRGSSFVADVLKRSWREELLLPEDLRVPERRLVRCQYSLWVYFDARPGGGLMGLCYSDSLLVRGVLSLLLAPLCELSGEEIRCLDWESVKRAWPENEGLFAGGSLLDRLTEFILSSLE